MAGIKSFRTPTDEDWKVMQGFMQSDSLKKEDFVVLESQAFGDKLVPNRYVRVMKEFLEVMARDAKKGVSFMLNHNESNPSSTAMPIGKVFDGYVKNGTQEGEENSLWLKRYIRRSNENNEGFTNNAIIEKIEDGTLADTSVGFMNDVKSIKCSICGKPYYIYSKDGCCHYAGYDYATKWDEDGNATEYKTCELEYYAPENENSTNTCLIEDSLVYDGAYPNATFSKQEFSNNQNKLLKNEETCAKIDLATTSERVYLHSNSKVYVQLSTGGKTYVLCNPSDIEKSIKGGSEEMSEGANVATQENEQVVENCLNNDTCEDAIATVTTASVDNTAEIVVDATSAQNEAPVEYRVQLTDEQFETLFGADCRDMSIEDIGYFANIGRQYKQDLIDEAITLGIKAFGNNFNKETKTTKLSKMSIEDIKDQMQEWQQTADIVLGMGERQSIPNAVDKDANAEEQLSREQIAEKLARPTAKDLF